MLRIGHRGAKGHCPENTLESFEKAIELGCHGIELDIHCSKDRIPFVIHDATLNRTMEVCGNVADKDSAELSIICVSGIPTLRNVLDLVNRRCLVNIELKSDDSAEPVVELISEFISRKSWTYSDFLVSSFNWEMLQKVRSADAKIPIGVLTSTNIELAINFATFLKAEAVHPYFHLLNVENVGHMTRQGLKIFAWTVNEPQDITFVKSLNVTGIISDYPERI
ncbi:MAG: glycerophosphodiester phosphodiesterase [Flavobacterium sp.]|nr:glycerophosphodiester phosphodiesterase [Flavobacterium sp.]